MMTFLITQLRRFLGGGASYFFIGLGVVLALQYWQINQLRVAEATLTEERDAALAELLEKDTVIASQARQYHRQVNSRKEQAHAEEIINAVPDSHHCNNSVAVNSAFEWLREHENKAADAHDDSPNVPVSRKTRNTHK